MAVTRAFMLRMPLTDVDAMTSERSARSRAPGGIDTCERATCGDVAAAVRACAAAHLEEAARVIARLGEATRADARLGAMTRVVARLVIVMRLGTLP